MLKPKYITPIIFGLIIVVVTLLLLKPNKASLPNVSSATGTQVLMTEKGFEPDKLTIKAGTQVTFINKDKVWHWPASDLHPTHTIYPKFDPKQPVEPGKSWSFTINRIGTWHYHDHLSPLVTGTIVVN